MTYSRILGTGSYLPAKIMTNHDLEKIVDTSDQWIRERSGIEQRHIAAPDETASSMGEQAARQAIEAAGIRLEDIDLIIVATSTPDKIFPSTASIVQQRLGISGCPAFDVSAACAGFSFAFATADNFIRAGTATHALVIGSEVMSRIINWQDRSTCVLFADGAGAVILQATDEPGVMSTHLHTAGEHGDLLYTPNPLNALAGEGEMPYLTMRGNEVFRFAVNALSHTLEEALRSNGIGKHEIDWLIPHQANLRIIKMLAKKLDLPMERVIVTIEKTGNTSSASVPIALDQGIRAGAIKRGELILLESFGGGFSWGSALVRY